MAPWVDLPLATGEGSSPSPYESEVELINLHLVPQPPGSPRPFVVQNTPAFAEITAPGAFTGLMRGVAMFGGYLFCIRHTKLYYHTGFPGVFGAWVEVGAVGGTSDRYRLVDAGTHLVIVDGTNAYACTTTTITACSRGNFSDVAYQDGFTFFTETGTNSVYASDLDDPTTIGALNYTTADALGGNCTGIASNHREILVFKETSTEFYYNSGGSGFPLARSSPGLSEVGCKKNTTISRHESSVFFLGHDNRVYRTDGYKPVRVSTPWVERLLSIAEFSDPQTYFGSVYQIGGRSYYALTRPGVLFGSATYYRVVLDIESGLWFRHEPLAVVGYGTSSADYDIGTSYFECGTVMFRKSGYTDAVVVALYHNLCALSMSTHVDTGQSYTPRCMTMPPVSSSPLRSFMSELVLDQAQSSGAAATELMWSDDAGDAATYNTARTGAATLIRTRWQRLGSFFRRTLRFVFKTTAQVTIGGVRARIEVGDT